MGREDALEKEVTTHSSILAWRIPWTEEPDGLYSPWRYKESDKSSCFHWLKTALKAPRCCVVQTPDSLYFTISVYLPWEPHELSKRTRLLVQNKLIYQDLHEARLGVRGRVDPGKSGARKCTTRNLFSFYGQASVKL